MSNEKVIVTKSKLDALATSISNKSGVATPLTIAQMKAAVDNLYGGVMYQDENGYIVLGDYGEMSRQDRTEPKDVDFVDYDGRLLYSYTAAEFANLTALPKNPTNHGLVAQGWNWTLVDAKEFVASYGGLVIGQNYTTDNGRTKIYLHVPQYPTTMSRKVDLNLTSTVTGSPIIHWGDGTSSSWTGAANTNTSMSHTYSKYGDYVIEIEVTNGQISVFGRSGANSSILGNNRLCRYVDKIEIGDNVTQLAKNTFKYMSNLRTVSFPITLLSLEDYDELTFPDSMLSCVVFPSSFTTTRYRAMFGNKSTVKYISIPNSMHNFHMDTYPKNLRKLFVPSLEPASGTTMTVKLYDVPQLTHFVVMGTYENIQTDTCRASLIRKLYIPSTVTNIAATAFIYNDYLEEVHLYPTSPPTLANKNAFGSLPSTCVIYVPYSADHSILQSYQTATNWSTFASQMQEESV